MNAIQVVQVWMVENATGFWKTKMSAKIKMIPGTFLYVRVCTYVCDIWMHDDAHNVNRISWAKGGNSQLILFTFSCSIYLHIFRVGRPFVNWEVHQTGSSEPTHSKHMYKPSCCHWLALPLIDPTYKVSVDSLAAQLAKARLAHDATMRKSDR